MKVYITSTGYHYHTNPDCHEVSNSETREKELDNLKPHYEECKRCNGEYHGPNEYKRLDKLLEKQ